MSRSFEVGPTVREAFQDRKDNVTPPVRSPQIRATTREGVLAALRDDTLENLRSDGRVRPATGITRPTAPPPRAFSDILQEVLSWRNSLKKVQGGFATDRIDQGSPGPERARREDLGALMAQDAGYAQRRFEFLEESEGSRDTVYKDINGIDHIGIGFNMEKPGAAKTFQAATGRTDFKAVKAGERSLTPNDVRALFDFTVGESEARIARKFKDVDLLEHQRLALVSLDFNNPSLVGPSLTAQVKAGDSQAAMNEILFRSNKSRHKGLANRRYREASMWVGDADAINKLPAYLDYIRNVLS